jgi:hypothetical protein
MVYTISAYTEDIMLREDWYGSVGLMMVCGCSHGGWVNLSVQFGLYLLNCRAVNAARLAYFP